MMSYFLLQFETVETDFITQKGVSPLQEIRHFILIIKRLL
jgi:hypothetical protein